jgi:hypothetical protein
MNKIPDSLKELLIIVGASLIIFFAFKPLKEGEPDTILGFGGKRTPMDKPNLSSFELQDDNTRMAYEAMSTYIDAFNSNESTDVLADIMKDFEMNMGMILYYNNFGDLAVCDMDGNDILVNC